MTSESINQIISNTEVDRGSAAAGWRSAESLITSQSAGPALADD